VSWNGDRAIVSSSGRVGLVRIVEEGAAAEAWIRFVPAARAAAIRAQYLSAVHIIDSWRLPDSDEPLPTVDRLCRMLLAAVGDEP
jgi:hypothetical protein